MLKIAIPVFDHRDCGVRAECIARGGGHLPESGPAVQVHSGIHQGEFRTLV